MGEVEVIVVLAAAVEEWIGADDAVGVVEEEEEEDDGPCINICRRILATVSGCSITVNAEYITVPKKQAKKQICKLIY